MAKMMKRLVKITIGLVVIVLVLLVVVVSSLGSIVKKSVNTLVPQLFDIKTRVESVSIRPLFGTAKLRDFVLANPEGYATNHPLFAVKEIAVDLSMRSLLSDTIVIHRIAIEAPELTYEVKSSTSNIDALIAKLNKGKTEQQEKKPDTETKPQETQAGKKVIIEEVSINGTKLTYASTVTAGAFIPLPLPSITLRDIGKEKGGTSIAEAAIEIFNGILKGVTSAVAGAADLIGSAAEAGVKGATDAAKATGKALDEGVKEGTKAVGSALDEVGGLFKSKKK